MSASLPAAPRLSRQTLLGVLCALSAISLFASFTLLSRLGITASLLSAADIALLRFAVAGVLMLPVLRHHGLGGIRWRDAFLLALCGGVGFAMFAYTGFSLVPASHGGALLHGTIPMFTAVLGWLAGQLRLTRRTWYGLLLIQAGIVAVFMDGGEFATMKEILGDLSLLMAGLCWAVYGLLCQRLKLTALHTMAIVAVGAMLCFVPVYALLPTTGFHLASWRDILFQAVFQGVLIGIISGVLYTRAVGLLGASNTALFTAAVPCITAVAGIWLLGEHPSPLVWTGIACVTAGMVIALVFGRHKS
ncbi:MAG: DMT family transporter [Castellaniella sp.]